jgi:hypothetical protein
MAVVLESMQLDMVSSCKYLVCFKGMHIHSAVDLGEIAVGNHLRGLVADTDLETSRAPVDELDGTLGLEGGNSSVGLLGDNVTTVQQAGSHVFAVTGVALDHLVVGLEAGHGDLVDRVGLVEGLGSGDDGSICNQGEVDTGVWHEVGLELVQVDVEGSVETERGGDGGDN